MSLSVGVAASRAPFYTEPVGQLPSKPRIKRLVVFAEGYGVFADYRDDFSLLDKIKQLFPKIVAPNQAHPQFFGCQPARSRLQW